MNTFPKQTSVAILLALVLMLDVGIGCTGQARAQTRDQEKAAQEYFQNAREKLNRRHYEDAAELFQRAFELGLDHERAGDALYWQAFSLYRLERTLELQKAVELLNRLQREYQDSASAEEGESLAAQVYAELAERGEADAAREITERAGEEKIRQETRTAALQALMQMDERKALPILEKIVQDDSPENRDLRRNALFIMCSQGGRRTEDLLIGMLAKEKDPEFLVDLVHCLAMNGSEHALDAMIQAYRNNPDSGVASEMLLAIAHQGGPRVFDFLAEVARDKDQDPEIRAHALMGLSHTDRERQATQVMLEILETETDREILEMALMSLSHMDDPAAADALSNLLKNNWAGKDEEFQAMALHFCASSGNLDLDTIRQLYKNAASHDMKEQICHVLTMVDDQDGALDLLIEIARNEEDPRIRRDAVFWVGQFDDERAAQFLLEVINED